MKAIRMTNDGSQLDVDDSTTTASQDMQPVAPKAVTGEPGAESSDVLNTAKRQR